MCYNKFYLALILWFRNQEYRITHFLPLYDILELYAYLDSGFNLTHF